MTADAPNVIDDDEQLIALIETWRATRAHDLADKIESLTKEPSARLTKLWRAKSNDDGKRAFKAVKDEPDDPRTTVMLIKCLYAARWAGSGSLNHWKHIFTKLIELRDARAIAALRDAATDLPHFLGVGHSKNMAEEIAKAADALEQACIADKIAIPEKPSEYVSRPRSAAASSTSSIEAVWAKPDDDATRLVVADALLEKNDPWGEFITLGMKIADGTATKEMVERSATLLHKHATVFGGPIAHVATKDRWKFEKGFLVSFAADRSQVPRRRWDDAASAPHWATVREVTFDNHTPVWWIGEVMRNPAVKHHLRAINTTHRELRMVREEQNGIWTVSKAEPRTTYSAVAAGVFKAVVAGMTDAERASIVIASDIDEKTTAALEEVRRAALTPKAPKKAASKKKAAASNAG